MAKMQMRAGLLSGAALGLVLLGPAAGWADEPIKTATGTEGADVEAVVVRVEKDVAAAAAPVKASILETQPQSIVTHRFIEQATPETGDYSTTILLAPSIGGISSAGGGVNETNKSTLRGFQDGQYNLTYDGIAFGDTNDPTHHTASYFPSSTIGTAVVDRGPGAAGDLGQANLGGAVHFFSPHVDDTMGASQKATYGSFNTQSYITTLNSGAISQLHGTKVLLNLDERSSDSELSYSSAVAQNQLLKIVTPINDKTQVTFFASHNYTRFYTSDATLPPGETAAQVAAYGKNWSLTNDPKDEHYYKYNYEKKQTDFEYIDFKSVITPTLDIEDQAYTYFYSNKTTSANDATGLIDVNTSAVSANGVAFGAAPKTPAVAGGVPYSGGVLNINTGDIQGYDKLNRYRVVGDIVRLNKDFGFGTLRLGGVFEDSWTNRHKFYEDLSTGFTPDFKYKPTVAVPYYNNEKLLEDSSWVQWQAFADFEWRPTDNLTITPGYKYVNFTRKVDAPVENGVQGGPSLGPINGQNTYTKSLYFLTANYRIEPYWSVYAQTATGFLVPSLSFEQVSNFALNNLKPEESTNYQLGTVYTRGAFTIDGDVYRIDVTNIETAGPTSCGCFVNGGNAEFGGVEGEASYTLSNGLTMFANGSVNSAKNYTQAPKSTEAAGLIYGQGPIAGTLTYKVVGPQVSKAGTPLGAYSTLDASVSYDFGRFKAKLAGFNLMDDRKVTQYDGTFYAFQVGRQIQLTLQAQY